MKHFLLIMAIAMVLTACYQGIDYCDKYEEFYLEHCQKQPTGLVGKNVGDHYQKSAEVWAYRFDLPGDSNQNCDLYFLETIKFKEIPEVSLVKWKFHNVGNAYYTVDRVEDVNIDTVKYFLKQHREWFMGQYQTDGICDGGGAPQADNFYVRLKACREYVMLGDTFGLQFKN